MLKVIVGILPGVIWLLLFVLLDKRRDRRNYKRLLLLFLIGGLGSYICYRLEMHFGSYFKKTINSNYFEILFYALCGVAVFEEGYKWIVLFISNIWRNRINKLDIVLDAIFISIGFATLENVLYYAIPYGYSSFFRITSAFLSHIANALWMGYFLEKAIYDKKNKIINIVLSFVIPILIHGFYNSFLYGNKKYGDYFVYFYILLIISTLYFIIKKIKGDEENGV